MSDPELFFRVIRDSDWAGAVQDDAPRLGEKLGPKAMACIQRELRKAVNSLSA